MAKEFEKVNISAQTYTKLKFLSSLTDLSMTKILENIIDCVFSLGVNYDKASLQVYDSQLDQSVTVRLLCYSHLTVGRFPCTGNDAQAEKETEERLRARIEADLKKEIHIKRDAEAPKIDSNKHSGLGIEVAKP